MSAPMQVTIIAKSGGPLTKRISLAADGSLTSDGSACVMSRGTAKRFTFSGVEQFADLDRAFRAASGNLASAGCGPTCQTKCRSRQSAN